MAISKYKTKKGIRYRAEVYKDGVRVAFQGGFTSRLQAHQWEKAALESKPENTPKEWALYEVVALYLMESEQRRKQNTISYKSTVLKRFSEFVGKGVAFGDISRTEVKDFVLHIKKNISPTSANKHKTELSALWSWAQVEGYATSNPARQVEPFPTTKRARYVPPQRPHQESPGKLDTI